MFSQRDGKKRAVLPANQNHLVKVPVQFSPYILWKFHIENVLESYYNLLMQIFIFRQHVQLST